MPLLRPEGIQRALEIAGLAEVDRESGPIAAELDKAGRTIQADARALSSIIENTDNDVTKLRAIELSWRARGMMKDTAPPPVAVHINIMDPNAPTGVNPIFIPRELSASAS